MQIEKCDICGRLAAVLQTCTVCKRRVCEEHFEPKEGMCSQCYSRLSLAASGAEETPPSATLFRLLYLGFLMMFAGVVVLFVAALLGGNSSVSGGGIIVIGFVPIVFGYGPYGFYAIVIAAILAVIAFAVFIWMQKQAGKS